MGLLTTTLNIEDRVTHIDAPCFVPLNALCSSVGQAGRRYQFALNASIEDVKAERKPNKAVLVKCSGFPDMYLVQVNMGAFYHFDIYVKGYVALGANIVHNMAAMNGGLLGGLVANAQRKKIDAANARVGDYLSHMENDVLPYAVELAVQMPAQESLDDVPVIEAGGTERRLNPSDEERRQADERARLEQQRKEQERQQRELERQQRELERQRRDEEQRRQREQDKRAREQERQLRERQEAERREQQEAERRAQQEAARAEQERRRQQEQAARREEQLRQQKKVIAEKKVQSKLLMLTSEEARTGCVKVIQTVDGRTVKVGIPAGVTDNTKLDVPEQGWLDEATGLRGNLRLNIAIM
ncbi:MAG: hypothetical protein IJ203_00495 [Atopobiaceae bacterium]|nr:hypothetical protein [Atopobiaceae bacterium]